MVRKQPPPADVSEDSSLENSFVEESSSLECQAGLYPDLDEFLGDTEPPEAIPAEAGVSSDESLSPGPVTRARSRSISRLARPPLHHGPATGLYGCRERHDAPNHPRFGGEKAWWKEEFVPGLPVWASLGVLVLILLSFSVFLGLPRLIYPSAQVLMKQRSPMDDFREEVGRLKKEWVGLKKGWAAVSAAMEDALGEAGSKAPSVLLVVGPDGEANLCLAKAVAAAAQASLSLKPSSPPGLLSGPMHKEALDVALRSALTASRVAVVGPLEVLSGASGLVLHGFADPDDPALPSTILLLTLTLSKPLEVAGGEVEAAALGALEDAWARDLPSDKLLPLFHRLAKNLLYLPPNVRAPNCGR